MIIALLPLKIPLKTQVFLFFKMAFQIMLNGRHRLSNLREKTSIKSTFIAGLGFASMSME